MEAKRARREGAPDVAGDPWTAQCQDVIHFVLLEGATAAELEAEVNAGGKEADAEFFHQHFGDDEMISGYKDLAITLYISSRTYHAWLDVTYKQKKLGADKVVKVFNDHFPKGLLRSKQEFIAAVTDAAPGLQAALQAAGTVRETVDIGAGRARVQIRQLTLATAAPEVQDLHARFEPLLLFFIDGASLIEKGDDKWDALLALQEATSGPPLLLGLTTLYRFWAYPASSRTRLSQILVLPPYRDLGVGKAMLAHAYGMARERGCVDLTLEDPTPELQRVREKVEVEALLRAPWVVAQAEACGTAAAAGEASWPEGDQQPRGCAAACRGADDSPQTCKNNSAGKEGDRAAVGGLGAITPPASFITRITHEFKIYERQVRLVWEAMLYLQPSVHDNAKGRAALEALVRRRLEAETFAHCGTDAERKLVVDMPGRLRPLQAEATARGNGSFIMMRVRQEAVEALSTSVDAAQQKGIAQGRLAITALISPEEKEAKLSEMCDERMEQLKTLKQLLARRSRGQQRTA